MSEEDNPPESQPEPPAEAPAQLWFSLEDEPGAALVVSGSSGQEPRVLGAADATRAQGYLVFTLDPASLPNPVTLTRRDGDGNELHVAGPCDPSALRDAVAAEDWTQVDALVGGPSADESPAPEPPPSDGDDPLSDESL